MNFASLEDLATKYPFYLRACAISSTELDIKGLSTHRSQT